VTDFVTPPAPGAVHPFRLVAMSDMQIDRGAPEVFGEIIEDGVIAYVTERFGPDLPGELAMALIPGDLVDNGLDIRQWREEFFAPGQPLFSRVPVYPVPGNHELNTPFFWQYFVLPENGTAPWLEHWWYLDHANLRVIGLDSNLGFTLQQQLDWLDLVLAEACAEDTIDFVFAQLHHPHLSELWPVGELDYTGEVVARLEAFSADCGKPSLHFFGHTHGYSRGQSRDHQHLWVNVASAGGNLDRWGEYAQRDYDEFVVSQDEYGFVLAEVEGGEQPEFRLTRLGHGQPGARVQNVVRDFIRVRRHNHAPEAPVGRFPTLAEAVNPDCFTLAASPFDEHEGDAHQGSHWQIASDCEDFDAVIWESWRQDRNWYFEVDTQAGDDLTDERVEGFAPEAEACWRVRYRDDSLGWSPWSAPVAFRTGPVEGNRVQNPGAEQGLDAWVEAAGVSESLPAGECQGVDPFAGQRYFAVGGLCDSSPYAELVQRLGVDDLADDIDAGGLVASYGAMMADYNGADRAEMELRFVGAAGAPLGASPRIGRAAAGWRRV
ncbi:MAG: metallophosphoesterase, partial [Myxococcales bacterium]|nr:metallophosphoesterase [Myxococcales bacterium]